MEFGYNSKIIYTGVYRTSSYFNFILIITAFDKILNILTKYNLQAHTCWSKNVTLTLLFELARE